jgi:GH24 family phage-related lysozyme (muramidase)
MASETQSRSDLKSIGADYDKIMSGQQQLNQDQIKQLTEISLKRAEASAKKILPTLYKLSNKSQEAFKEIVYNMGADKIKNGFPKMMEYLSKGDTLSAAKELLSNSSGTGFSDWVFDIGQERASYLAQKLKG